MPSNSSNSSTSPADDESGASRFTADCSQCGGLCCIVPAYLKTQGFPTNKPAEHPCRHLTSQGRCEVHDQRLELGFAACTGFDCYGAGQWITAHYARGQWGSDAQDDHALAEAYRHWLPRFRIAAMLHTAVKLVRPDLQHILHARIEAILDPASELAGASAAVLERETVELLRPLLSQARPTAGSFRSVHSGSR